MPEQTILFPTVRQHVVDGLYSIAVYDPSEVYRYYLKRTWDDLLPVVAFIGLNPSTATERQNDPTVRRCMNYAQSWGFGGFIMLNAFGFRSTDPMGLRGVRDPIGPQNDDFILKGIREAKQTVACWGNHAVHNSRHDQLRKLLENEDLYCFVKTRKGYPNHPLYLKKTLKPVRFRWGIQ